MVSRTQQGFLLWAHLAPSSLLLSPVCPAPPHQTGRQESQLQPSCTCTLPREANACYALPRALAWGSLLLLEAPCWGGGLHVAPSTLLRTFTLGQEAPSFWERNFSNLTRMVFPTVTAEGHSTALGPPTPRHGSSPSPTKALAPALQDAGPPFPSFFVPPGFQLHAEQRACCSRSPGRANKGPQLFCCTKANSPPHSAGWHEGAGSLRRPQHSSTTTGKCDTVGSHPRIHT